MTHPKLLAAFSCIALVACSQAPSTGDTGTATNEATEHDHAHDGHDHSHDNVANQVASNPNQVDPNNATASATDMTHDHDGDGIPDHDASEHKLDEGTKNSPLGKELHKPGPRISWEFNTATHHFGEVMQGMKMEHVFELTSGGTETLVVKQIKPTCGCTVADLMVVDGAGVEKKYQFGDPIPVGTKMRLAAVLDTKNKRGAQSSSINVFSNDVRGPVQLSLQADVSPFFHAAPTFLNFGQMSTSDTKTEKVTISVNKGDAVTLSVEQDKLPQGVFCDMMPINPDAEGKSSRWEMLVTVGPGLEEGNLAQAIRVVSDYELPGAKPLVNGDMPTQEFNVTASARILGVISHNPQYLSMGLVRPGQVMSRTVRVESHDAEFNLSAEMPCRVTGIKDPKGGFREWEYAGNFSTTVRPVDGANAVDVELSLDGMPEGVNGSFRGTLVIEVGHSDKSTLEIPITGVCRGGVVK